MSLSADNPIHDVAIVGLGPVSAIFANLLAKSGLRVAVVERVADIYDKPRAITLDHEALRVLQAVGLGDFMEQAIAPHNGSHYLGVDGEIIKIFDPMPPPFPLGWIPNVTFVQPDVEQALRDKLTGYPNADIFLAATGVALQQHDGAVMLTARRESGEELLIRARYLVGCDGANSFVRKQLGIGLDDLAFDEWWMVVDTLTSDPARRPAKSFQYCWPSRPGTFVPGPRNLRRWEIKLLPGEDPEAAGAPDNVVNLLKGFTDISDLTIWRSAVYRFHALLGQRWRDRRVLLMGDAVHQTPPFLGQGLCAGIRDAVNLAWKLRLVLRGDAGDALLDSYEIERKPHVRAVVASAKEFGKIIGELDPVAAVERDLRLRADLKAGKAETIRQKFIPDLVSGLIARDAALAGRLFVQPHVRAPDGRTCRLDDLLKLEFAIVTTAAEPMAWLSEASSSAWQRLSGERVVIATSGESADRGGILSVVERDGLFAEWMRQHGAAAVIVRPDRYVFGAAGNADELNMLVGQLLQNLSAGR
ncbi:bifunctional 3-(3-hydroxy-phenyl)propionate/3-hydroxycinnamic acid hydroxylase [Bradyrhizobium elkanii]|uniref:bifunctional 3-(3-hydroxy-phenyl)propionate/3-hydroxycinnamic acid hydroxylase MhpA n=1 Tax=Bradyrhizobium elkanii TaxID=29448 RepID=UPI0020A06A72|nr:bifunctional 3-(3-hydroxy-phenyl)propionate/3-hydroxycinnamic acid hydroxylase [Bradyrhizobium elkanii]MCP1967165.1 3-(3-hydroxy-phenyl)propionate hydroxylase [Bradyrhizobium elkanii]MCS3523334.1 3-(3-hydroxy-phenyl)propionate hydroxylase [Bradyrhizobium elkanii]MCS4070989.1 3-(3-hydroxy-phenyl)propionate hydroxylase [Bradyrhizobium elkanii]MCS4077620.1 3-(3-hydroxy-phenyl)propionate hydroxylase [Bradyrhizobium elkanii]MCS4111330.1 3-(3-hydroxy-phenyl)propionate hydroxylase [Bradyrhizobium 